MKADAVFEGGGVKGIGLVGAVCVLEEKGYTWENVAGTSAGSIIAALLSVGYSGKELKEIMMSLNYKKFLDKNVLQSVPLVGKPISFFKYKGIYLGNYIENWIGELLKAKGKTKFKDVSINGKSRLKIIASDITGRDMLILPDDLKKFDIDPLEFDIARAVRMSISIPFYFNPIEMYKKDTISYIVDGGILSNFPVWIFDVKGTPRWPTFGFKLEEDKKSKTSLGKTDVISFLQDIISTVIDKNEEVYVNDKGSIRTISIPTLGVGTTEFNITKEKQKSLFDSGCKSAEDFIRKWDFEKYVRRYRI